MSEGRRIAYIFPGQGAQYVGMGRDFAKSFATARQTYEEASDLVGEDIARIAFEGPEERLKETRYSQTAIYVTSIALLRVLQEQLPFAQPVVVGGLSLGEYTALTAAGRLPFRDCLPVVQWRGQVMHDACESTEGAMAAIMGLSAEEVEEVVAELGLPDDLWAANFNCPGQVVLSGTPGGIMKGIAACKARGARRALPLQVHGAFHSGLMKEAQRRLAEKVSHAPLRDSEVALVMNVTGRVTEEESEIRRHLIEQVTSAVRWEDCVHSMMDFGTDLFIEFGPGNTLGGMNKRIGVKALTVNVNSVEDVDAVAQAMGVSAVV